jgi:hypothetical protein
MDGSLLGRRAWLRLCGAVAAGGALERVMRADQGPVPAAAAIDHLLLGIGDLDTGMAWVEERTGVRAAVGGQHPGVGTRNALLSFGGRQYLEIIAPDPAQQAYNAHIDVRGLAEPRLMTWAAATADIEGVAEKARRAGYRLFGPRPGSRARPDGQVLRWTTLGVLNAFGDRGVEPMPFFIEWAAGSRHPAEDSPGGCRLQAFAIEHPDADGVRRALDALGIEASVTKADAVGLRATLQTPRGTVDLR